MRPDRPSAVAVLAAGCAGVAAWLSMGTLALTEAGPSAARVGLLPPWWLLGALIVVAVALALATRLPAHRSLPLFLSGLLVLPWLPGPVPDVFLLWAGPGAWFVWVAVGVGLLFGLEPRRLAAAIPAAGIRGGFGLFLAALIVFGLSAWRVAPVLPGGDEPHYLVITQSLIEDGDLQIENNHRQGDYHRYFAGDLRPDYLRRGTNGQIYSIHAPGLAVLVLPAFAMGGYPAVKVFLILLAALAATLAWHAALRATASPPAALFAWAGVTLTAPYLFLAFTVYPDGAGAALVMAAVWALVSLDARDANAPAMATMRPLWWWVSLGAACAALPWLHPRYAVLAGTLGIVVAARIVGRGRPVAPLVAFSAVPLASAAAWFGYFRILYGSLSPSSAYGHYTQLALANLARGLPGLLFDQQFGLIANAPVYALALAGFWPLARRRPRLAAELALVIVPYAVVTAAYQMWWGGHSSPARFLGPVLLALAVPMAAAWQASEARSTRVLGLLLLSCSLVIAGILVLVERGHLAYNFRDGYALWLLWASPLVSAARSLPSLFRTSLATALAQTAVWVALGIAAWLGARALERRARIAPDAPALIVPACLAAAIILSVAASWRVEGSAALSPAAAQLQLLRAAGRGNLPVGVSFDPLRLARAAAVPRELRLSGVGVPGAPSGALLWLPNLPAGRYRLCLDNRVRGASLNLAVSIGRTDAATAEWHARAIDTGTSTLGVDLPVAVHSLAVRGQVAPGGAVRAMWLEPVDVEPTATSGPLARASAARRYGDAVVYGLGDDVYLEPGGLWVGAGSGAGLLIASATPGPDQRLLVRAGPVATSVDLSVGTWQRRLDLTAGESRDVSVPREPGGRETRVEVRASPGFRPADLGAGSTDTRLLGVWVEVR